MEPPAYEYTMPIIPASKHKKYGRTYRKEHSAEPMKKIKRNKHKKQLGLSKNSFEDSKKYLVVLKNGARIPMNRNEYIAYQIALAQSNPKMLSKSYRKSPSRQTLRSKSRK